jgi:hypothetical protein
LISKLEQHRRQAVAGQASVVRSRCKVVTNEPVLWEWLNALADSTTRAIAAEGYRRVHADIRIEVVPFEAAFSGAAWLMP